MEVDQNFWKQVILLETTQRLKDSSYGIKQQDESASYHCMSECVEHVKTTLTLELLYSAELKAMQQHHVYASTKTQLAWIFQRQ